MINLKDIPKPDKEYTEEEYVKMQVEAHNNSEGDLKHYDCEICKNKGTIAYYDRGKEKLKPCECMPKRKANQYIEQSGLKEMFNRMNFQTFKTDKKYHATMKRLAIDFMQDDAELFLVHGQVGSGKSHLCTAMTHRYLNNGKRFIYKKWRELTSTLRSHVNDEEYSKIIHELTTVKGLYIDDFLKTQRGKTPSESDLKIAFDIIDGRYNKGLITILSSENGIDEIYDLDPAVGSRIFEMTKKTKHVLEIPNDDKYDMRRG